MRVEKTGLYKQLYSTQSGRNKIDTTQHTRSGCGTE